MKKILLIGIGLLSSVFAMDTSVCNTVPQDKQFMCNTLVNEINNIDSQINTLKEQSEYLLKISEEVLANASNANETYVYAMLRLSDDIGTMADRIGVMADRILFTEEQIGVMADRILETQRIQSENLKITEENILKAQENFNETLKIILSAK